MSPLTQQEEEFVILNWFAESVVSQAVLSLIRTVIMNGPRTVAVILGR